MDGSSHAAGDSVVGSETRIKKITTERFHITQRRGEARLSRVSLGVDKLSCCLRRWAGASVGEKNPGRNGRPALMITAGGRALSNADETVAFPPTLTFCEVVQQCVWGLVGSLAIALLQI